MRRPPGFFFTCNDPSGVEEAQARERYQEIPREIRRVEEAQARARLRGYYAVNNNIYYAVNISVKSPHRRGQAPGTGGTTW
jgi:hypothetical protein